MWEWLFNRIRKMTENKRLNVLKKNIKIFTQFQIVTIIMELSDSNKIKALDICKNMLESDFYVIILRNVSDDMKVKIIEVCADYLNSNDIEKVCELLNEDRKLKILKICKDKLSGENIVNICNNMSDKAKIEVLEVYKAKMSIDELLMFSKGMSDDNKLKIWELCKKGIESNDLLKLSSVIGLVIDENVEVNRQLLLPKEMTIGMEIESEGTASKKIKKYFNYKRWLDKDDPSLNNGIEIVSPVMHSGLEETKQIYMVNNILKSVGQFCSERCGGHIHIGADYLSSKQSYINLLEIWCNTEKILYAVTNEKQSTPRKNIIKFAKPFYPKLQAAFERGSVQLDNEESLDKFIEQLKEVQSFDELHSRRLGLNLINVNSSKNTIEFRIANGTLNSDLWIENINLFGGIVAVAEELAQIQKRDIVNESDKVKLELFKRLKTNISEVEKLEILLKLINVEPEVYMDRYEVNIRLLDSEKSISEMFSNFKMPITFDSIREVVKKVSATEEQNAIKEIINAKNVDKADKNKGLEI